MSRTYRFERCIPDSPDNMYYIVLYLASESLFFISSLPVPSSMVMRITQMFIKLLVFMAAEMISQCNRLMATYKLQYRLRYEVPNDTYTVQYVLCIV